MANANLFAVAGVAYDILGAILLAQAIAFSSEKLIAAQSGSYFGGNITLFTALDEQRHDARFGLVLLVFGFALQFLAALNLVLPINYWPAALAIPLAWFTWYWISARQLQRTRNERFQAHLALMLDESREASTAAAANRGGT